MDAYVTTDQLTLLRDKIEVWTRHAQTGPMDYRDYNRRAAEALKALLADWEASDPQPYKDALDDLLFCRGEQEAIGGGPGWQERDRKAWAQADELMRVEP